VQVACCFPWSRPYEFISLRDDKGREQVLIEDLQQVDAPTRGLIENGDRFNGDRTFGIVDSKFLALQQAATNESTFRIG
jgi:hypothetical protein